MEKLTNDYAVLFNGVTDALDALDRQDYGTAKALLIRAQQLAEFLHASGRGTDADQENPSKSGRG